MKTELSERQESILRAHYPDIKPRKDGHCHSLQDLLRIMPTAIIIPDSSASAPATLLMHYSPAGFWAVCYSNPVEGLELCAFTRDELIDALYSALIAVSCYDFQPC